MASHPVINHQSAAAEYYFKEGCHITEWWNSPSDEAASVARARIEPGVTTKLHRLKGTTERYVVLEGSGRVEIGELPAENVGPGDTVLIPPGVSQRIANTGRGDLIFLAICTPRFTPDIYETLERE